MPLAQAQALAQAHVHVNAGGYKHARSFTLTNTLACRGRAHAFSHRTARTPEPVVTLAFASVPAPEPAPVRAPAPCPNPHPPSPSLAMHRDHPMHPEKMRSCARGCHPVHTYRLTAPHGPDLSDSIVVLRTSDAWNLGTAMRVVASCLRMKTFAPCLRSLPTRSKSWK